MMRLPSPWILAALVIGAIPGATACRSDGKPVERPTAARQPDPVADFVQFARTPAGSVGGSEVDYIAVGLRTLAGALDSRDVEGMNLPLDLRVASAHVVLQPASLEIAELMRSLALRTAAALAATGETPEVLARAKAISAGQPLTEQIPVIQAFFEAAAGALEAAS
jgi:hypothetical protein